MKFGAWRSNGRIGPIGQIRRIGTTWPITLFALAGHATAQTPPPTPPAQTPPSAQGPPKTPDPTLKSPLEPAGFPGLGQKDDRLPAGQDGPQELRIISIGTLTREGDILKARNGVHLQYKGYDIFGKEVDGNLATNIFILRGEGQLIGSDAVVLGEIIIVNFDEKTFRSFQTAAEVRPSFLQGRTLDNVYLNGGETWGSQKEIYGFDTAFTTCNLDKPHYELDAKSFDLRPNKRIILRNVKLEILGRRIFNIPFVSIPLDNRRERYTPEVGHTPQEGYYIKTKWGIPLRGPNDLDAYVDYFEKLGAGVGGRFRYFSGRSEGFLRAYGLTGNTDTVEIQQGHRQLLGPNLLTVENNYQQRNFLNAPENTIWTSRVSLNLPQGRNNTRVSYNRTNNESASFQSTSQTMSISDSRTIWEKFRSQFDLSWVKSDSKFSGGGSERQQVDIRFKGIEDLKKAQAELEYQRSIPVGETSNFFSASDKTPVLTLKTDAPRLFGKDYKIPFNAEVSMGEFVDPREKDRVTRTNFDIRTNYSSPGVRRFQINVDGRFKQSFYSDDTAQYAVGYGTTASYALGVDTALRLRYNYLEREGFTPLSIDRVGKTNLATMDLSYRPIRTLKVGLQTGYDFLLEERHSQTAWQTLGLLTEWQPKNYFMLRAWPVYDPFSQAWSSVRLDMTYLPGATYVAVGARYDGLRKVWGAANIYVEALKWGRAKLSTLLTYNGYLKKFEEKHYSLTYDMHCAEAVLQIRESNVGFRAGREIAFFIRLKAFPFDTPFGLSRRGAPIGLGTGRGN